MGKEISSSQSSALLAWSAIRDAMRGFGRPLDCTFREDAIEMRQISGRIPSKRLMEITVLAIASGKITKQIIGAAGLQSEKVCDLVVR